MKKLLKRMIALIMLMTICVTSIYTSAYAQISWDGVSKARVYEEDGFKVTMSLSSYWNGGYNADIKIENTSDTAKENWYLGFEYDDVITNIWNAEIVTNESGYYVIKNATWNQDIAPKSYVQFGISSNEDFGGFPDKINILGTSVELSSDDYIIDYKLDNDWGTGFVSTMSITNMSEETIEDWVVEFDYDREITNIWNGTIESHEGNHYVIKNAGYNANISTGQSITFGFNGCEGTATDVPYDYKLVAYKVIDSDGDGISDYVETALEMNKYSDDTDGDGLTDYEEVYYTATDPIFIDTDSDGICDKDDDTDEDGLDNFNELQMGTDATKSDSDNDGLTDYEEVYLYFTEAIIFDTDGDVVSDGMEIQLGTDPLVRNEKFMLHKEAEDIDSVKVSVDIELTGEQVYSLSVEKSQEDFLFPDTMPGYIGGVYEFMVDGTFEEATLNFEFDNTLLSDSSFEPVIYYYNESEQELEELETVVEGNVAKAKTTHFSKYILLNRTVYEEAFEWQDVWVVDDGIESSGYSSAEVVLVIDDSGSMVWNDANNQRLSVAQELVSKLPLNSKVGVVKFEYATWILSAALLTDRNEVNNLLTTNYFKATGETYMYKAISNAFALFGDNEEGKLKMMIVLSDGASEDTNRHNSVITAAKNQGVKIYTVGLGTSTSYFNNYLQPLASNTGGEFYFAEDASQLADIYESITNKVDIETDSDGDGITDYYEDNLLMFNGVPLLLDKNDSDTDNDGVSDGEEVVELKYEYNEDRTKVIVTGKINSNPAEIDTDFDGIDDLEDDMPRSNLYKGVLKCSFEEGINVSFRMNYRNLIDNSNTRYSVQKSELSSIFATLAYGAEINITEGATINGSAEELYTALGLEDFADYSKENKPKIFKDDDITELLIGHRLVRYQGKETEVFIVSIRGTDGSIEEWSSNFDVGANDEVYWDYGNPEWTNYEHHKGFDVAANRCYDLIEDYIEDGIEAKLISDTTKKSILITGHSRGAAIANLLGKKFEEDKEFISTVYTFATPNTTTSENPEKYETIFNIVNEDDLVPYLPLDAWGFDKYGTTKPVSVKKDYENSWFRAQEGTWEWLINANREDALDYNYNGHKESTLKAFEKLFKTTKEATSEEIRKSIYVIPNDEEAILELDTKYKYWDEASEARKDISEDYGKRLMNGCELYVGFDAGFLGLNPKYKVQVKQSPHFLMMAVAALAAGENPENKDLKAISGLGYAVAKKYNKARVQFIHSAVDSVSDEGVIAGGLVRFGGMAHGHWQETYYLLAKYER